MENAVKPAQVGLDTEALRHPPDRNRPDRGTDGIFPRRGPLGHGSDRKAEALARIAMPVTMGHAFRASHVGEGRVFLEAIEIQSKPDVAG